MISFDRSTGKVNLSPVWDAIGSLSGSVMDLNNSISNLPSDVSEYMAYYASINSSLLSVNSSLNSIVSSFSNYELTSDAFNSSVLTDYAKTSDIPTNTGGGGDGKYQYAFSELPSDANYGNLYNITGDIGNMTFYSSDSTKTGKNLLMTMAGGYFNSNSIESISSLYINNILEFNNNTGYMRTLQLINCKTISSNSLSGMYLSLNKCYITPNNVFSANTISCNYITISSLSVPSISTFVMSRGAIYSLALNNVRNVDINCENVRSLAFTGYGSYGVCDINALQTLSSCGVSNFSAANINCSLDKISNADIASLKILNMNCTQGIWRNTIKNVSTFNMNCGLVSSLFSLSEIGQGNITVNGNIDTMIIAGCTEMNIICNSFEAINADGVLNLKIRDLNANETLGDLGMKKIILQVPDSGAVNWTMMLNTDHYSKFNTIPFNLLNYVEKSDWMSYNTNMINSNLCSMFGMPVSLLA